MFKKVFLPIIWVVIALVATGALVKIAFFPEDQSDMAEPSAELATSTVKVERTDIVNSMELDGTVTSLDATPVRSTQAGIVTIVDVEDGQEVSKGDRLFQVRMEEQVMAEAPMPAPAAAGEDGELDGAAAQPAPEPTTEVTYHNVNAPASGKLDNFQVMEDQMVSLGDSIGQITPPGNIVTADLSADQQFRLLDRPSEATITVEGGPAPFECENLEITSVNNSSSGSGGDMSDPYGMDPSMDGGDGTSQGNTTGQIECDIPDDAKVFPGLQATVDVTAGEASDVLTLPTTAVRGTVGTGTVYLPDPDGGDPTTKEVTLGLSDGERVEITDGLAEGVEVLQFVPGEENPDLVEDDFSDGFGGPDAAGDGDAEVEVSAGPVEGED